MNTAEIAAQIVATGQTYQFEENGSKFIVSALVVPDNIQSDWAVFHSKKDQLAAEANAKLQKEESDRSFKMKSRLEALKFSPTSKVDDMGRHSIPLTASEIAAGADIMYNWLVKDLIQAPFGDITPESDQLVLSYLKYQLAKMDGFSPKGLKPLRNHCEYQKDMLAKRIIAIRGKEILKFVDPQNKFPNLLEELEKSYI